LTKARGEAASGTLRRSTGATLREAWEAFYTGAQAGTVTDRTGNPFKASTCAATNAGGSASTPI